MCLGVVMCLAAEAGASPDGGGYDMNLAELSLDELMRMEVTTAGKVPEQIKDTPASVYLVSRDDIERYGYQTLTDVFENVPGFYNVYNYGGVSGNFGIRGFWNGRSQNSSVAILINGVPQMKTDTWSHPMELLNVPVEAIDRIEIVRGPNSVIYGTGAAFGAINIITDESYYDDQVAVSYGSRSAERVSARWSTYGDDSHLVFNAGIYSSDGVDPLLSELMSPESREAVRSAVPVPIDLGMSFDEMLESRRSFAQLAGTWRDFFADVTYNSSDTETYFTLPAVTEGTLREASTLRATVGHSADLPNDFALSNRLTYALYDEDQNFDVIAPGFVGYNYRNYDHIDFESLLHFEPGEEYRFTLGFNWQRMKNFFEYTHVPDLGLTNEVVRIDERDTHSLFGQLSWQFAPELRFVAGYRLEELDWYDREVYLDFHADPPEDIGRRAGNERIGTPRASLIYQPDESQVWKLMAGDAVKMPAAPDAEFDPERVRTVELNYTLTRDASLFSLSLFRNSASRLLIEGLEFTIPVDTDARDIGEMRTKGIELLYTRDLGDYVRVELAGTLQDAESFNQPSGIASYSPEKVAHLKLAYQRDDFSAALLGRYVGEMYPFYSVDFDGDEEGMFIGDKVDGYTVLDATARWDDIWNGMYVALQVSNLLDAEIRYPNNPINSLFLDKGLVGPERRFHLTAGFKF